MGAMGVWSLDEVRHDANVFGRPRALWACVERNV